MTFETDSNMRALIEKSDELKPLALLMAEIIAAVSTIERENLFELVDRLVMDCGSIEAATAALKSGEIKLGVKER